MGARQVTSIDLWVQDLPASLAFYRLLGIAIPEGTDNDPTFIQFKNGLTLGWGTEEVIRSYNPYRSIGAGSSRIMLEIKYDHPSEVDAMYAQIIAAGHRSQLPPFNAFWGARFAIVEDPDRNPIGLTANQESAAPGGL